MGEIANAIRDLALPLWGIFVMLGLLLWVIAVEMGGKK